MIDGVRHFNTVSVTGICRGDDKNNQLQRLAHVRNGAGQWEWAILTTPQMTESRDSGRGDSAI